MRIELNDNATAAIFAIAIAAVLCTLVWAATKMG